MAINSTQNLKSATDDVGVARSVHPRWDELALPCRRDDLLEAEIDGILAMMTLEEKLGQMIQAEVQQLTPEDIEEYKIGSALNGAGVWPAKNRFSTAHDWATLIEGFWTASANSFRNRPFSIPFAWATDAVHGHNNLFGATLFPHNIGLGATRDGDLIYRIGRATAEEISASGMDWTFAPTVAVPMDPRWGRFYEGYSQDPFIVREFAAQMVRGLEGRDSTISSDTRIMSSIKHWIGDGGTRWGVDRGTNYCSEDALIDIHSVGYQSALAANSQVVMVSFSSWEHENNYDFTPTEGSAYNYKMHGSRYLITEVLKQQLGFDGLVLTDWDGHCEVTKCTLKDARYCINSGADVLMVEARGDWLAILENTKNDIQSGLVKIERVDDAVRRVLRVKRRMELAMRPAPTKRAAVKAANSLVGCAAHRLIAREAVRKSLVLLKNEHGLLPLSRDKRVLVGGSAAANLSKQVGGWSLNWQSSDVTLQDFPSAVTLASALEAVLPEGNLVLMEKVTDITAFSADVAVIAIGEDAYAEMMGDIKPWRSLEYASLKPSYQEDLRLLREIKSIGIPLICIFFGGRPLYITEELNLSDSFVVAWLPGIAGEGITDVLMRNTHSEIQFDFQGRLPCSWPATPYSFQSGNCQTTIPSGRPEYDGDSSQLFSVGYGISYSKGAKHPTSEYPLYRHGEKSEPAVASSSMVLLGEAPNRELTLRIAGNGFWVGSDVSREEPTIALLGTLHPIDRLAEKDAFHVYFNGRIASMYFQFPDWQIQDMRGYLSAAADLVFDLRMQSPITGPVRLSAHNCYPSEGVFEATDLFRRAPQGEWTSIRIPLLDIAAAGSNFAMVNVPFMLHTDTEMEFDIGNLRWEVNEPSAKAVNGYEDLRPGVL